MQQLDETRLVDGRPGALAHFPAVETADHDGAGWKVEHGARTERGDQLAEALEVSAHAEISSIGDLTAPGVAHLEHHVGLDIAHGAARDEAPVIRT